VSEILVQDLIDAFRDAMAVAGVPYRGPIDADGERHRFQVDTDKKGKKNGWYLLFADGKPNGVFGSWKGVTVRWTAEGAAPLTKGERERIRADSAIKHAAAAAALVEQEAKSAERANAIWDAAKETGDHPYLRRKGVPGCGLRVGDWVKDKKDGTTYVAAKGALLIPLRDKTKKILSMQAVFAKPVQMAGEDRDKDFVYGGRKRGLWFAIGKPLEVDGVPTLIICEGYATGASLHRATGMGVIIAFDAKNLIPVAEEVRRILQAARIVIAGDNDAFTFRADQVTPWNPGIEAAKEAARACNGLVCIPHFPPNDGKPTDFNDLDVMSGLDEVKRQVMAVVSSPAHAEEAPPWDGEASLMAREYVDPDDNGHAGPPIDDRDDEHDTRGFFKILGHDRDHIFIYQYEAKLIMRRPASSFSEDVLITLADLNWWEREFPVKGGKFDKSAAKNWLVRTAYGRGFFDPTSCRGRGAWRDAGRIVYHFGNKLIVDGEVMEVTKIDSGFVYEQARKMRLPSDIPLSSADGRMIVEVAKAFHWSRPASALLWVGWCALAPVCGALSWRPHIWLTGGAGSGKTTILNLAHFLMNGGAVYAQGNSTEAGIRQTLQTDALPVLFDESEQNNEREAMRMQNVLSLVRQSSSLSDAKTLKGTQGGGAMEFRIQSMFQLSSIQVNMKQQADMERMSVLSLRSKHEADNASENWKVLSVKLALIRADADLPGRMVRRSLDLLPVTIENIVTFAQAAAEAFGSQRDGDQYGALLAGAWSLVSTNLATLQEARDMIKRYDWSDYLEGSETEESSKALAALTGTVVSSKGNEASIYTLIKAAAGIIVPGWSKELADTLLENRGLKVVLQHDKDGHPGGALWVSNASVERDKMMMGSPYAADLKGQLKRVLGARASLTSQRFGPGQGRFVTIPLSAILGEMSSGLGVGGGEVDDDLGF
jgi:putative DNA primase/helicase